MSDLIVPSRRGLLAGLGALICAPAVIRVADLMSIKPIASLLPPGEYEAEIVSVVGSNSLLTIQMITKEAVKLFRESNGFVESMNQQYENRLSMITLGDSFKVGDKVSFKL